MTREEAIKLFRRDIECLSHDKCSDCILEEACDPMKTPPDSEYIAAYGMAIEALSTSEIPNKWIPVSERLPEDFQRVLVTIVNYNGNRIVRVAEYLKGVFRVMENNERWEVGEKGLLAWMPLPEPYMSENPTGSNSEEESEDT